MTDMHVIQSGFSFTVTPQCLTSETVEMENWTEDFYL